MRTSILISKTGTLLNPSQSLINYSPINGEAASSLFFNQITVEFYTGIITLANGIKEPNTATAVTSGLSGTIQLKAWASAHSPYPVVLSPLDTIDVSNSCMLQWTGITQLLDVICSGITGANYINVLLDRA